MQFLVNKNYAIIQQRKIAFGLSMLLILAGIVSLIIKGGPKYSIDFTGGTEIVLHFQNAVPEGEIRGVMNDMGLSGTEVKAIISKDGSENISLKIGVQEESEGDLSQRVLDGLKEKFPDNPLEVLSIDKVGPKIGNELKTQALWAIIVSLIFIIFYISVRFEFKFGVGAIVALAHDVLITLGIFSILNYEISLAIIGAFLTIIGYSLNDTIVVYDRIRENIKKYKNTIDYEDMVNRSINESLSRTVITSLTTLLVVLVLLFFGGDVIRNFAFALTVGVIVGTYSSIYIASPLIIEWQLRSKSKTLVKKK